MFSQVVLFGDSDTDGGDGARSAYALNGQAWPASPPYYRGRFTNGLVWPEYFAPSVGLRYTPAENHAVAGARTDLTNVIDDPLFANSGFLAQVQGYVQHNPDVDRNALFVVWGGSNNFVSTDMPVNDTILHAMQDFMQVVSLLAAAGARTILTGTLPNLGYLPAARAESTDLLEAGPEFNRQFHATMDRMRKETGISIVIAPIAELVDNIIADPGPYGFANTRDACLHGGTLQGNPSTYVFWDTYHYSTAVHRLFAEQFAQALQTT